MSASEEDLVGHSYTRARRHPLVIGKLPGAGRIPGGPYTITQIVTMVVVFGCLALTQALWAHFGLANILIMIALPWGLAWVLRYARIDGRDPARALRSLLVYASAPAGGRLAGRPQRQSRPHLTRTTCTVRVTSQPTDEPVAVAPARAPRAEGPRPVRRTVGPAAAAAPSAPANSARTAAPRTGGRSQLQSLLASLEDQNPRS
ncbi:hypothetical protein ACFFSH_28870 [Streptomyces filamentosus]|uniref:Uncharacterized protein n=1 Tax=Streptomyces filamentosus TaxID=67294 RepID=A0A919BW88_STRFL|nr:hypothetical protein [Streptomyces filamentosus]GHG22800.1 hypothetical protein GCM10017667_68480 [Streptomyces filamentosus]